MIGLYLAPPQHAAVFCVDEKTAIQALDRLDPVLPLSPGRLERHGFEYLRNGTLSQLTEQRRSRTVDEWRRLRKAIGAQSALSYVLFKQSPASKYRTFEIPKRNGGARAIKAPTDALKLVQQRLSFLLKDCVDEK